MPGVLSRALPTSFDGPLSPGKLNAHSPTPIVEASDQDEAGWPKSMHWFRCITGAPVDDIMEFGCTMIKNDPPLHKRSLETRARHFFLDEVDLKHDKIEPQSVIDLHPCFLEKEARDRDPGRRRLICEAVDQVLDENSVDAGLQALAVGLINGLQITIGPELTSPHKFGPHVGRLVSIYPSGNGNDYDMLMTNIPHIIPQLGPFLSAPKTPHSCMKEPTADMGTGSGGTAYINDSPHSPSSAKTARQKLQGFLEGSLLIRCWFQLNEQALSAETICALSTEAGFSISGLTDSSSGSNFNDSGANESGPDGKRPDTSYPDGIQDPRDIDSTERHPGNLKHDPGHNESDTNSKYFKRQSPPETLVDRWFLCWTGSGSKMLCEIPDWYIGDSHHPQSKHMRRAVLQTYGGKVYTPLLVTRLPRNDEPLHFLVDSPPLWRHCRSAPDPKSHTMQCLDETTHRAVIRRNRADKSTKTNQTFHRRDTSTHPPEKGSRIISDQPPHNITSTRCGPGKASAFGKLGETFAFIGFFTVLTVFTIVLSWLVKHLFLAIYDGLEEWTTSRRRKRALATVMDFGISDSLDKNAPVYGSADPGFQRPVDTLAFPQTAVVNEEAAAAVTTTGSQAVDGGSDSIKRKKAAMRATVSEEPES